MVSGEWVVAPSTPNPPARLTAATTSRQWLKANSGNSTPSISQTGDFILVSAPSLVRSLARACYGPDDKSRRADMKAFRSIEYPAAPSHLHSALRFRAMRRMLTPDRERNCQGSALMSAAPSSVENDRELNFDVVVVGAGFAGMYMLHRLRGLGFSVRVYEQGSDVGGTWYWNRYPGARCDVESMQYSYSFSEELQQEWNWSERYAPQPEILKYARHVADRFGLRPDIVFDTCVERAEFDESTATWQVATSDGNTVQAQFVVLATGCLSNARMPDIKGLAQFAGKVYHTGHWPHEGVDFSGMRVGVIGTGSSAIQSVPVIAGQASHLFVFQRTPNFSIPSRNAPMTEVYEQSWKSDYPALREKARHMRTGVLTEPNDESALELSDAERAQVYEERWAAGGTRFMAAFNDLIFNQQANDTASEFVRNKIRATVNDAATAEVLAPKNHPIGTKRICVDTDYYGTYNRPNVKLVDVSTTPISEITVSGLRAGETEYPFDAIVFATGFDA